MCILQRLYEGESLELKELSEEFNVNARTIRRDFDERLIRFPIEKIDGRYKLKKGFRLEKSTSFEDILILDILEGISQGIGGHFYQRAHTLLKKIKNETDNPLYIRYPMENLDSNINEIRILEEAISQCHAIKFHYQFDDYKHPYHAEPYKLINFQGFWYLLAKDLGKNVIKKFRIKKISTIAVSDETFVIPGDLQEKLEQAADVWFNPNAEIMEVLVRVSGDVANYIQETPLTPTQQIEEAYEDGAMDVTVKVTSYDEIIDPIFKWLPHIKVLEPQELDESIMEILESYINYWGD